jgi:argininosuccinate lyase
VSADGSGGQLWAGRFSKPPAPAAHALGRSLHFDRRLASQDVEASIAHVRALQDAGLLDAEEAATLEQALGEVGEDIGEGRFVFQEADEDVHSAIERAVTERLGDLGAKLHAGRSRNDLVVTDLRLWLLAAGRRIDRDVVALSRALVARAREHAETVMPGTTHSRFAQPVTLGHHLLAHGWALARDLERLEQWSNRTSTSPLGAGATAGSTLGLDPDLSATRLGFHRAFANSIDAVSDRDFVQEFLGFDLRHAPVAPRGRSHSLTDESLGWASLDEAY